MRYGRRQRSCPRTIWRQCLGQLKVKKKIHFSHGKGRPSGGKIRRILWLAILLLIVLPTACASDPTAPPTLKPLLVTETVSQSTPPLSSDTPHPEPTDTLSSVSTNTPTNASAPSITRTPTNTPTSLSISTPTPKPHSSLVVESAQRYDDANTLRSAYQVNVPGNATRCRLDLATPPDHKNSPAIVFTFTISQPSPNDYCGFERWLASPQDWSGYDELCVTVQIDGNADELIVQFGETSDEVWKTWIAADSFGAGERCLPLSTSTFGWADWSVEDNGRIDLGVIDYYGFYVNGDQGAQGQIYVDQLRVVDRQNNEHIAFISERDGNHETYVMHADGTNLQRLTYTSADEYYPAWTPDGSQIAFHSNRDGNDEIYVMNADGSDPTRLTFHEGGDYEPAWSPDGHTITFSSERTGGADLYMIQADGTGLRRITTEESGEWSQSWSPNGQHLVFHSDRDNDIELYKVNLDGTNVQRLTQHQGMDNFPAWSPDGQHVIFTSDRSGAGRIWIMAADGTGLRMLMSGSYYQNYAAWSLSSSSIVFMSSRDGNGEI
jgi:Tol biopolymer transport system component